MGHMEKINDYLESMKNKGCDSIQAMYLLAEAAGMEWFRASEAELEALAENIGNLEDWE